MKLAELAALAGGEYIRRQGRYALVRWDIDTVSLETRETLLEAIQQREALELLAESPRRAAPLERALQAARGKLAATRPEDYSSQRAYQAVRTRRERLVRQLEKLLFPEKEENGDDASTGATGGGRGG